MKLHPYLTSSTETHTKWIKDLNLRSKTVKILETNINPCGFGLSNGFLAMTAKAQAIKKKKKDKLALSERNFCAFKDPSEKVKKTNHRMGE